MPKTTILIAFILGTIAAESASAQRFLPAEQEATLRASVPELTDTALAERIADDSQTFAYKSKRFWQRNYSYGGYKYTYYSYGRGRRRRATGTEWRGGFSGTSFQRLTKDRIDIQWRNPSGQDDDPHTTEIKIASFPKVNGQVVPMIARGTKAYYPNGMLFLGVEQHKGKAVEIRMRQKVAGEWQSSVLKPQGSVFTRTNADVTSCAICHQDASERQESAFGWSGVIGADENFSFGDYAVIQPAGNLTPARFSGDMVTSKLLEFYDESKHSEATYGRTE